MMKEAFREQEPLWAIHDEWFDRGIHTRVHTVGDTNTPARQEEWDHMSMMTLQAKKVCAWPWPRHRQK